MVLAVIAAAFPSIEMSIAKDFHQIAVQVQHYACFTSSRSNVSDLRVCTSCKPAEEPFPTIAYTCLTKILWSQDRISILQYWTTAIEYKISRINWRQSRSRLFGPKYGSFQSKALCIKRVKTPVGATSFPKMTLHIALETLVEMFLTKNAGIGNVYLRVSPLNKIRDII